MNKQKFFDLYAPIAIEQQQKYGIPASVTLAQAALESTWGENVAARESKNFFGIHATKGWQNSGKPTHPYRDNGQMVPFCVYGSAAESFEHHSEFLKQNKRYSECFKLSPTDHRGWAYGICRAGYAARPADNPDAYAKSIETIIRQNGLEKYDQLGLSPGKRMESPKIPIGWQEPSHFSFPLAAVDGSLVLTSDIGHRHTGIAGASTDHNGLDLRANYVPVLATEDNGKVVKVDNVGNNKSGKHIIVEYERDGHKYNVSYCHLSSVNVKEGDTVSAGKSIGVSGNSSYRDFTKAKPLDPHLHLTVRMDGHLLDPKVYLAEIAVRGGIDTTLVNKNGNGRDLLADLKQGVAVPEGMPSGLRTSGYEIAVFSQKSLMWGNANGQPVNVGDIGVTVQDGKYMMSADINGQVQTREISKEDYEKFLSSNGVERLFQFDRAFDDVAMIGAGKQQSADQQNPYTGLIDMINGNGSQDFMSWFLNKNGDGAALGASGDILGDLFGMVVGGLMSLQGLFDSDEDTQVQQLRDLISARMSPEDQAKVDKLKREGVDPERAKILVQTNCEAGLTSYEQQQQQQQQVTLRG